jgi:hypothetical protein
MAAKKNTATETNTIDAIKEQMQAVKGQIAEMSKKGFDLSEKSFDETVALTTKLQDQGFDLMARNIELMKIQMGFVVENQTALLDLCKSQTEAVRKLMVDQAHEAIDTARARLN